MNEYILSIDVGTTSIKTLIISSGKKIVAETTFPHDLLSLHPNWAEEDAEIWWEHSKASIAELLLKYPEISKKIIAIGVSGMVPAIVLLDEKSKVLRRTIQQNDARAITQLQRIEKELDQNELFEKTGSRTNQQHIIPRLLWVKENEPEVWSRINCIMGSYDYIAYKLTGTKTLEINWAIESGAFDIHSRNWLTEQLARYGINTDWLPSVNNSNQIIGTVREEICKELGLPKGISVIAGSADHVASTLAAGIISKGDLLIKFGGAGDILYCIDEMITNQKLFFDYHLIPDKFLLNGCMAASGSLVKWLVKDLLHAVDEPDIFKRLDDEAEQVPPASNGLIILPYFSGEKTPLFDPTARGVMFGLTLAHKRGHIFRAILEAVVYGFHHHIDVLASMGYRPERIYATNGGAKSKFWCQIAADVFGQRIVSFPNHPGSSLGTAFLAGISVGVFTSWEQIYDFLTDVKIYEPNMENHIIYKKAYNIYLELYKQIKPSLESIQNLYI